MNIPELYTVLYIMGSGGIYYTETANGYGIYAGEKEKGDDILLAPWEHQKNTASLLCSMQEGLDQILLNSIRNPLPSFTRAALGQIWEELADYQIKAYPTLRRRKNGKKRVSQNKK